MFTTLVLSGGSYKGYSYIGVLRKLEELKINKDIKNISCCSVGSIFGLFFSLHLSSQEMLQLLDEYDINRAYHFDVNAFLSGYGFCDFTKIRLIMSDILEKRGLNPKITFLELYQHTKINYVVNATCLETRKCHYFNHANSPDLEVLLAIQMSCAIPLLFVRVCYQGKTFVDGGILDNLPVTCFNHIPKDHILSVYLTETVTTPEITSLSQFIVSLISMITANYNHLREKLYYPDHYLVKISVPINFMKLELDRATIHSLVESGYQQTSYYFALWRIKYGFKNKELDITTENQSPKKHKIKLTKKQTSQKSPWRTSDMMC